MGRGRAKAKQTKVARDLKYRTHDADFGALARELHGDSENDSETESDEEGCLSLQGVRVPVDRSTHIVLEGKDPNGDDVRYELDEYGSRVVQHELDHLDGVLIIDRTDPEHRKEALGKLRPQIVLR